MGKKGVDISKCFHIELAEPPAKNVPGTRYRATEGTTYSANIPWKHIDFDAPVQKNNMKNSEISTSDRCLAIKQLMSM